MLNKRGTGGRLESSPNKDAVSEDLDSKSDYSHPTEGFILPAGCLCSVVAALTYLCPQLCYEKLAASQSSELLDCLAYSNLQLCLPRANPLTFLFSILNFQGALQGFRVGANF